MMRQVTLAHGGGGEEVNEFLKGILKLFDDDILNEANDAVILGDMVLSTDSFVLSPIFLDEEVSIGKLYVCGSVNDILMMGVKPLFLSLALILEEGFAFEKLEKILRNIEKECDNIGVKLVCGDTKVVPEGKGNEIYINTTALGQIIKPCQTKNLKAGLSVLLSGDMGAHGASVLVKRNELETDIKSDCKCVKNEVLELLEADLNIVTMRDATRRGLSAVSNERATFCKKDILIYEEKIAVKNEVLGLCELFGYEPYELANESTFVLCIGQKDAQEALEILQKYNKNANTVGEILPSEKARVILQNSYGAKRFLESPKDELLPRIC